MNRLEKAMFQQAPTLGGECYEWRKTAPARGGSHVFQRAPTLGGECYAFDEEPESLFQQALVSTGTHPWG
jgi:hypothetical protein